MPIYEYVCRSCGHALEALQKIGEAPLSRCPGCGAEELKKKVTAAAFRLKGTGWYETDFKDKKKPAADKKDAAEKTAAGKTESKSDGESTAAAGKDSAAKKPAPEKTAPSPASE
ncbi:MAG: zinc ribbon domain-containing protein [Gammaproteobacteria bacterium]|nr:zinc ribbon domain-containing protein [Gammaproteobacteria bacterium]